MKRQIVHFLILSILLPFVLCSCNDDDGKHTQGKIIKNAVKDADGNIYDAVKIGEQVWMAENLRTTLYDDGAPIPLGGSGSYDDGYRYYPNGIASNVEKYGYLYSWYAVMNGYESSEKNPSGVQGICPKGWHVPSDAEWQNMINYIESQINKGRISTTVVKAIASTKGWEQSDRDGTPGCIPSENNYTGFNASPVGKFSPYHEECVLFGKMAYFWTASVDTFSFNLLYRVVFRDIHYNEPGVHSVGGEAPESSGFSVRCVRD